MFKLKFRECPDMPNLFIEQCLWWEMGGFFRISHPYRHNPTVTDNDAREAPPEGKYDNTAAIIMRK